MRKRTRKTKRSTAFLFWLHNRFFLIRTVLSQKTLIMAPKKNGIIAWDVSEKVFWPSGLHIVATLFASMVQAIGEKEGKSMRTKIKYTEEPMGDLKVVKDFLPPPDQLVLREENVKVTISLKKSSISFFKEQAKKQKTSYQKMIREVVDWYASHYQKGA